MFFHSKNELDSKKNTEHTPLEKLIYFFKNLQKNEDFPLGVAVDMFQKIDSAATTQGQLIDFCLEDIIFSSLYATIYEELLITCKENRDVAIELIDKFLEGVEEREQKIAAQTQQHIEFIENGGHCDGCTCCDNHNDVLDLLTPYNNQDTGFFIQLYIGMQTIQISFEQLIYDYIPTDFSVIEDIQKNDILKFREYIYTFTENQLRS